MKFGLKCLAVVGGLMMPLATSAATVEFTGTELSQGLSVTKDGLNVTLSASNGGVANTYGINSAGTFISGGSGGPGDGVGGANGPGFYIGAIEDGAGNFGSNTTAPASGTYALTFDQAVTSFDFRFEFLTNDAPRPETVLNFGVDGTPVSNVMLSSTTGTSLNNGVLTTSVRDGQGNLSYSGAAFTVFSFDHTQTPSNIGFTITSLSADVAPVPLPAGLPLLLVGLGGFGVLKRRKMATV